MLDRLRKFFRPTTSSPPIDSTMFLDHTMDYAGPFHVDSGQSAARCVRLKDGRLHVYQPGSFPDLLDGPQYILARRPLADALRDACGAFMRIVPVDVINVATGKTMAHDYFDLFPYEEVTPETFQTVDATGRHAWHFRNSHLFVTKQVVLDLQKSGFTSLQFDPGFSGFIGNRDSAE